MYNYNGKRSSEVSKHGFLEAYSKGTFLREVVLEFKEQRRARGWHSECNDIRCEVQGGGSLIRALGVWW